MALKTITIQCPNLFRAFPVFTLLFFIFSFSSCTEPEFGTAMQPDADELQLFSTFELVPECQTMRIDSIPSSNLLQNSAGVYYDPILGQINASLVTQFRLQLNNINFGLEASVDSMILALPYAGAYGDVRKMNGLQKFTIFELDTVITTSKVYYSNDTFKVKPNPIGESDFFVPRLNDRVRVGNTTVEPQLRIKLKQEFAERFVDQSNTDKFVSSETFLDFFKGIVIKSELKNNAPGQGSIIYFDLLRGARIELYYKNVNNDSLQSNFVVNELSARINTYQQTYKQVILDAIDNPQIGKQMLFNHSTGGLRTKITFPTLDQWKAGRRILLNKAELELSVDESSIGIYPPPLKIDPITENDVGQQFQIPDFGFNNIRPVGGNYLFNEKKYRFTITKYLQDLLDGKEDKGLYLMNTAAAINANRVKFFGTEAPEKSLKLKLVYQIL